ncbi:integrase, catalytic region, zinc finger, CCHC-type containing protein [Tanacetum coccineum]
MLRCVIDSSIALAVARKGHPKMIGTSSSSSISKTTKLTEDELASFYQYILIDPDGLLWIIAEHSSLSLTEEVAFLSLSLCERRSFKTLAPFGMWIMASRNADDVNCFEDWKVVHHRHPYSASLIWTERADWMTWRVAWLADVDCGGAGKEKCSWMATCRPTNCLGIGHILLFDSTLFFGERAEAEMSELIKFHTVVKRYVIVKDLYQKPFLITSLRDREKWKKRSIDVSLVAPSAYVVCVDDSSSLFSWKGGIGFLEARRVGRRMPRIVKPRVRDSNTSWNKMLPCKTDEAGVILPMRQNDCLFADASRMEEREELKRDIKEMKDVFKSTESELYELEKQNDFLKDQLLEVSLKHEVDTRCEVNHDWLQHEKEKHKWDSSFKNKNTNPLDYSWISKLEKLEDENVSLDFTVQSLIKEHDNVKIEYQKLFNSIKKTRSQTQTEMDELIAHVSEKTYAYGAIRAENQNLLFTMSELKTRLAKVEKFTLQTSPAKQSEVNSNKNVIAPGMYKVVTTHELQTNKAKHNLSSTGMNASSSVRRPMNIDSHVKNGILANSKKPAKKVAVYVRKNKQTDITSENVISNKENVIDVDVANASKAKTLLCVSCVQNVLIPCHDNCFANYKLNVRSNVRRPLSTKSRTPNSYDTTYVVRKTRFSKESTLYMSLDTTYVVSKPKIDVGSTSKANDKVVQIVLWIVDSSCSKHMTGDRSLLKNFIEKFMGTVRFGNDNFAAITGYGDYIQGNITICHVYYVEGLGHNLFSVGQFCDGDLEVAFRSKTCYVRNLEGDDLLTGGRESNLYTISISDMAASSPVCLMSKATSTKSWLWHRRLSHLNFGTINDLTRLDLVDGLPKFKYGKDHLCSACERGKSKKASHPLKLVLSDHSKLELLHMDLCGLMRVASINGKKYILVIVDDHS